MTNTNGFDDFDTQVTAEEFYAGWTEDEADYHEGWREEQAQEDTLPDDPQGFGDGFGDDTPMYPHDLDGFEYPEFDC